MRIACSYQPYETNEVIEFVAKSKPIENTDLTLYKGTNKAGWVDIYFRENDNEFKIIHSLVFGGLEELVQFFESMIDLKVETAIFLDDECIAEPLLYVSPVDETHIRLLIADGKDAHDSLKHDENRTAEPQLSEYTIRCDSIVNKKKLLKEFYRAVKNIIDTDEHSEIYELNYNGWKDNLKNIIAYCERK